MRYAQIKDNKVINVIEADTVEEAEYLSPDYMVFQDNGVNIGWYYTEGEVREIPPPPYNKYTHTLNTQKDENGLPVFSTTPLSEEKILENLLFLKREEVLEIDRGTKANILLVASESDQRNHLARTNELLEKKIDGAITSDEEVELSSIKALWTQIEDLLAVGYTKKTLVTDSSTMEQFIEVTTKA